MTRTLIAGLALAALAGCATGRRSEPLVGAPALDTPEERHGERVFMVFCNQCHPQGDGGVGPALNNKPAPAPVIKLQVRTGLGRMPAFSDQEIDDRSLDALMSYMKTLRRTK